MSWKEILKAYSEKVRRDIDRKKEKLKNMGGRRIGQERGKNLIYADSHELAALTDYGNIKPEDLDKDDYERFIEIVAFEEFFNEQPPLKRKEKPKQRPNIDPNQPSIFDL